MTSNRVVSGIAVASVAVAFQMGGGMIAGIFAMCVITGFVVGLPLAGSVAAK